MSGQHNLAVGELTETLGNKKGESYFAAVEAEMTGEHAQEEGSEENNQKMEQ